jgi:hypothetical protein
LKQTIVAGKGFYCLSTNSRGYFMKVLYNWTFIRIAAAYDEFASTEIDNAR